MRIVAGDDAVGEIEEVGSKGKGPGASYCYWWRRLEDWMEGKEDGDREGRTEHIGDGLEADCGGHGDGMVRAAGLPNWCSGQ